MGRKREPRRRRVAKFFQLKLSPAQLIGRTQRGNVVVVTLTYTLCDKNALITSGEIRANNILRKYKRQLTASRTQYAIAIFNNGSNG